jgi:hypothetical protein
MFQAAQEKIEPAIVDLDETSSISEYSKMFECSLRLEYEEHLRLYELYSLYHVNIFLVDACPHPDIPGQGNTKKSRTAIVHKKARLFIDGIADARPTLQIGDIVLLRPINILSSLKTFSLVLIIEIECHNLKQCTNNGIHVYPSPKRIGHFDQNS